MKMTSKKIMTSTIKNTSKTSNPPKVQACMKKRLREDKPAWRQLALCRTTHGAGHIPLCGIFLGTLLQRGILSVCFLTGLSSLVVESQLIIVFKREIPCLVVVTCLRNVSILMILMSVFGVVSRIAYAAWPNCDSSPRVLVALSMRGGVWFPGVGIWPVGCLLFVS